MEKFDEKTEKSLEEHQKELKQSRQQQLKMLEEDYFSKLDIVGDGVQYIPGGNGRRRLTFRTAVMKTLVTMDEPKGKETIKDLNSRDTFTDAEIAVKWVSRVEYDESRNEGKYPRSKKIVDLTSPDENVGEKERLIKDIESWGLEELESLSIAFLYLNKRYFYEDFLI